MVGEAPTTDSIDGGLRMVPCTTPFVPDCAWAALQQTTDTANAVNKTPVFLSRISYPFGCDRIFGQRTHFVGIEEN
jgi:hypothetical protein